MRSILSVASLLGALALADNHVESPNSIDLPMIVVKKEDARAELAELQTSLDWYYSKDGTQVETIVTHNIDFLLDKVDGERQVFQFYSCIKFMAEPICFVTIGLDSIALRSITASIYNLSKASAEVDGPNSVTVFSDSLANYYYYNGKVGKDKTCDDCPFSILKDDVEQKKNQYVAKFKFVTPVEDFLEAKKCGYHLDVVQRAAVFGAINRGFESSKNVAWEGEEPRN